MFMDFVDFVWSWFTVPSNIIIFIFAIAAFPPLVSILTDFIYNLVTDKVEDEDWD